MASLVKIGLFRTTQSGRPSGVSRDLWEQVCFGAHSTYNGPAEHEPSHIEPRLSDVRAGLARLHHEDPQRLVARRNLDDALLELRLAAEEVRRVESSQRPQPLIVTANRSHGTDAAHARSEAARAELKVENARRRETDARGRAEQCNVELQNIVGALADRMHVIAREAVAPLQRYIGLLNAERVRNGADPLPSLSAEVPDQLVLQACRRPQLPPDR